MSAGEIIVNFLPLVIFGALIFYLFRRAGNSKETTQMVVDSNDRLAESNIQLADAVNRLADIMAKNSKETG